MIFQLLLLLLPDECDEEPKISIENIDSKLNWSYQIDYIANRISKSVGIIVKVKNVLNLKTTKYLYNSFISVFWITVVVCAWGLACTNLFV